MNSNVVQGGKFKVGDKVSHEVWGVAHVVFGPFHVSEATGPCYLTEDPQGKHRIGSETLLSAHPRFEAGQVVRAEFEERLFKVVSGPFPWRGGTGFFYVVEDPSGGNTIFNEDEMTPVVE